MTLTLDRARYQEFTFVLFNPRVVGIAKYFSVSSWLSEHGVDPKECYGRSVDVVFDETAIPAVRLKYAG